MTAVGLLTLFAVSAVGQDTGPVRCVAAIYRLRGEEWRLVKSVKFNPKLAEEELTNKVIDLPASKLRLLASVFPTDESMHSAKGADSIKLGLAISKSSTANAFDIANNAVAEGTLSALDTLRVERTAYVKRNLMLTRLECWDSTLEKETSKEEVPSDEVYLWLYFDNQ